MTNKAYIDKFLAGVETIVRTIPREPIDQAIDALYRAWETRRTAEEQSDILDRHRKLAWAISNRDPEEAERRMAAHFDEAIGALLR